MNRAEYDSIEAENFSTLRHILVSPQHYLEAKKAKEPEDELKYAVGTLVHAMVLEGKTVDDFAQIFDVKPKDMSFATTKGKAWRAAATKQIIKASDVETVQAMAAKLALDPMASRFLQGCPIREQAITFEFQGVRFKSLIDMHGLDVEGRVVLPDYKSAIDCTEYAFSKKVDTLDYDMQLSLYREAILSTGKDVSWLGWLVQDNKAPYEFQFYLCPPDILASGQRKLRDAIYVLKKCQSSNTWPGYPRKVKALEPVKFPKQYWREEDESN